MNFSMQTVITMFFFVWTYSTINDYFRDASIEKSIKNVFGDFNNSNYTHSLINYAKNGTQQFAAVSGTLITTCLSAIPVSDFFLID